MMKLFKFSPIVTLILLAGACAPKVEVKHALVSKSFVELTVSTINSGTIEAEKEADLAFGTMGRVAKLNGSLGKKVHADDILAELENADFKAVFIDANNEFARSKELFSNGLISKSAMDMASKNREVARLNLEKTYIRAPFPGLITAFELKVGEFYQTTRTDTKPVVKLIDLNKRIVKGEIDEVDLYLIKIGQAARVKIPAMKRRVFEAKLKQMVPFVSTAKDQDRTSQIILEIDIPKENAEENLSLIPVGASADVEIVVDRKDNVLTIPTSALQGLKDNKFVYKIVDGKTVKTEVKIGLSNYDKSEVLEGLVEGDNVLIPGEKYEMAQDLKVKIKK